MQFSTIHQFAKRNAADLLVIPLFKTKDKLIWPAIIGTERTKYEAPLQAGDFTGKESETALLYPSKGEEKRVLLLGLGDLESLTVEKLRRVFSETAKICKRYKVESLNLIVPDLPKLNESELFRGISEGILLTNYSYDLLKSEGKGKKKTTLIKKISFITHSRKGIDSAEKAAVICQGVYFVRDLVNGNADDVTPDILVKEIKGIAKGERSISVTVFDKKRLSKEGMGLLLAVGRASRHEPAMIIAKYEGKPHSKENIVLVGKGITYDTGGLNLKTAGGMETMKADMGGAAACIGTLMTAVNLKLKVNLTIVIPTAENCISELSYKPGDVYTSYLGKTVEITNTDAEGRLILADALAYTAKKLKPTTIIDVATLTGAIEIALGNEMSGVFSNNDILAHALVQAGNETYERLWRMPVADEYRDALRTDIADMRNSAGRAGSACIAAMFLKEFVGDVPWAHLDIAGTAFLSEARRYHPRYGTGFGVRLLIDYLEHTK